MKNIWFYTFLVILVVLIILVVVTLPKGTTKNVNYTPKLSDYNDRITLNYMLTVDGNVIDSSYSRNKPLTFVIGSGQVIPGFDKGVLGLTEGQEKTFKVSPKEGYGLANVYPYKSQMDLNVVLKSIKTQTGKDINADEIQGGKFYNPMGQRCVFDGYDKNKNIQRISCQNRLAGKTLTFKVSVLKIEKYGSYTAQKPTENKQVKK